MLCAKNLKVVKAALIMILGVGGFTSAQAEFNLTSQPTLSGHDVAVYAAETIATGAAAGVPRTTELYASATRFMAKATIGFPLPAATGVKYYARYDLVAPDGVTAKFVGLAEDDFSGEPALTNDEAFDISDGARVIYSFDAAPGDQTGTPPSGDTVFALDLHGAPVDDPATTGVDESTDPASIAKNQAARVQVGGSTGGDFKVELRVRVYDNIPGAISGVGATYLDAKKPIVAVDNTLNVVAAAAAAPAVADVAAAFTMFAGASPKQATLGNVHVTVKRVHDPDGGGAHPGWMVWAANTGMGVSPTDVMSSGSAVIDGDYSVGTFKLGGAGATLLDANDKELEKFTAGDNKGKYMNPADAAKARFAVSPAGDLAEHPAAARTHVVTKAFTINVDKNTEAIPAGSYSATTSASPKNPNGAAIADKTAQAIGSIIHNGTTVHLGYLTTFEGHNQRLVMVNRGPLLVDYKLQNIVTETGTMASEGAMATGQIMPKSSKVIQVRDLVTFEAGGTTRASATLTLTAKPSDISVATTLVNTMDRSTDTVEHH